MVWGNTFSSVLFALSPPLPIRTTTHSLFYFLPLPSSFSSSSFFFYFLLHSLLYSFTLLRSVAKTHVRWNVVIPISILKYSNPDWTSDRPKFNFTIISILLDIVLSNLMLLYTRHYYILRNCPSNSRKA